MLEKMSLLVRYRNHARIIMMSLTFLLIAVMTAGRVCAATANGLYSLSGAQYQLYTDKECTQKAKTADGSNAILKTNKNGDSAVLEMEPGTYYAKEIKASRGYMLDTDENGKAKVHTVRVTASDTKSDPATFTSREPPVYGVPDFMVLKTDPAGAFDYTKLLGAKFTVKYYDVASREDIENAKPKSQWTFETVKKKTSNGSYMAGFDWQSDNPVSYSHNGKTKFYGIKENGKTKRVLPLGWFTIEETEAPPGFWLSDRICYGHVYQQAGGGSAVTEIEGTDENAGLQKDTLVFIDQPFPVISTSASLQGDNSEVKDIITYENLEANKSYVFRGWLVDTVTGEKVPGSEGSVSLESADESSGQVEMVLNTEGYEGVQGHSMTAFEELYLIKKTDGKNTEQLVAEHKDIGDSSQTVEIYQDLEVRKKVTGNLGDLSKEFEYTAEFTGLVPECAYTVEGFEEKVFNADQSGNARIPLKLMDGKKVTIKQIPKGATYQITETASDHVSEYNVFSEDMKDKGAKIVQVSGSKDEDPSKALATALETVDLYDGTVVVVWENNRNLAALTGIAGLNYMVYAAAVVILAAVTLLIIRKHREYADDDHPSA